MAGKGMESDMLALCAKHLDYDGKFTKHLKTSPHFTHTLTDYEKDSLKRFESAIAILALLRARSYMKIRNEDSKPCLLYTSPSPRDQRGSRMPSSA